MGPSSSDEKTIVLNNKFHIERISRGNYPNSLSQAQNSSVILNNIWESMKGAVRISRPSYLLCKMPRKLGFRYRIRKSGAETYQIPAPFSSGLTSVKIKNAISDVSGKSWDEKSKCETSEGLSNIGACLASTEFQLVVEFVLVLNLLSRIVVAP